MYMRHRLDLSFADLLAASKAVRMHRDGDAPARQAARALLPSAPERLLTCYTVRSGFHALLAALALPVGSEIMMSGISVRAMAQIPEAHGLVVVPIDLDHATLAPSLEQMQRERTSKTRALVIAHLYGGRVELRPYVAFARQHGLLLIEDCAQSFTGIGTPGHEGADVSMFSFGMAKTATAVSGAVLRMRDVALLRAVAAVQDRWPTLPDASLTRRIRTAALIHAISQRPAYDAFAHACEARGVEIDDVINRAVKAFPSGQLLPQLEFRPSPALLSMLARRLERHDPGRVRARGERGEWLRERIEVEASVPGRAALDRSWWMFPVVAPDPSALIRALWNIGMDATRASTAMVALEHTLAGPDSAGVVARTVLDSVVYVPAYPEIPQRAFAAVPDAINEALRQPARST